MQLLITQLTDQIVNLKQDTNAASSALGVSVQSFALGPPSVQEVPSHSNPLRPNSQESGDMPIIIACVSAAFVVFLVGSFVAFRHRRRPKFADDDDHFFLMDKSNQQGVQMARGV